MMLTLSSLGETWIEILVSSSLTIVGLFRLISMMLIFGILDACYSRRTSQLRYLFGKKYSVYLLFVGSATLHSIWQVSVMRSVVQPLTNAIFKCALQRIVKSLDDFSRNIKNGCSGMCRWMLSNRQLHVALCKVYASACVRTSSSLAQSDAKVNSVRNNVSIWYNPMAISNHQVFAHIQHILIFSHQ